MTPVRTSSLVGISAGFTDYGDYLGVAYSRPLSRLGALPVVLPYLEGRARRVALERLDALVLGVGRDLEPWRYGAQPHPAMTRHSRRRDEFELRLVDEALRLALPVLGICRGMQIINVALGGTLHSDRSEYPARAGAHPGGDWQRWDAVCAAALGDAPLPEHPSHPIRTAPGSLLERALGSSAVVNSYHHQAIHSLGGGVRAVAWAPDGIVEAIEVPSAPGPCIGVQWELQESWQTDPRFFDVFRLGLGLARPEPAGARVAG